MGEQVPPGERQDDDAREVGESSYVLPPVERQPLAGRLEKRLAILRVIAQAEHERGARREP